MRFRAAHQKQASGSSADFTLLKGIFASSRAPGELLGSVGLGLKGFSEEPSYFVICFCLIFELPWEKKIFI